MQKLLSNILHLLAAASMVVSVFASDQQTVQGLITGNQLCINKVIAALNLQSQISTLSGEAQAVVSAVQNLCITGPQVAQDTSSAALSIVGTAPVNLMGYSGNATILVYIYANAGAKNIAVAVVPQSAQALKFAAINSQLQLIDQQVTIVNGALLACTADVASTTYVKLLGKQLQFTDDQVNGQMFTPGIKAGFSLIGHVRAQDLLGESLAQLGMQDMLTLCTVPRGTTLSKDSLKKIIFKLQPFAEAPTGLCVAKAFVPLMNKFGLTDVTQAITPILQAICWGTDIGFGFNENLEPVLFIDGPLKSGGKEAMLKVMPASDEKGFALGVKLQDSALKGANIRPELAQLDNYLTLSQPTVMVSSLADQTLFDNVGNQLTLDAPNRITNLGAGLTTQFNIQAKLPIVTTLLRVLQLDNARVQIFAPLKAKSFKQVKFKIIARDHTAATASINDLLTPLGINLPASPVFDAIKNSSVTTRDTDVSIDANGHLVVRFIGSVTALNQNMDVMASVTLDPQGTKYAVAVKPSALSNVHLASIHPNLSVVDQQVQLQAATFVISNTTVTDNALITFAAATPQDITIIKQAAASAPQTSTSDTSSNENLQSTNSDLSSSDTSSEDEISLDDLLLLDEGAETTNDNSSSGTASEPTAPENSDLAELPAAEQQQVITLAANLKASVTEFKPGLNVVADVTAVSGSLLAQSLQQIGVQSARATMYVPQDVNLRQPTKTDLKKIIIGFKFLQEPAEGMCLARGLTPLMSAAGFTSEATTVNQTIGMFCFGTDVGVAMDEDLNMTFFIAGPLKSGGKQAMIKVGLGDPKAITLAWESDTQHQYKFSDIHSSLQEIDGFATLRDIRVIASNADNASAFDIQNNQIDPTTPGAITGIKRGITVLANITNVQSQLSTALQAAGLQNPTARITVPFGAKSIQDIDIEFVGAAQQQTVCLKNVAQSLVGQMPSASPVSDILNICMTTNGTVVRYANGQFHAGYTGTANFMGQPAQIRVQFDKGDQTNYTVIVSPSMTGLTFNKLSADLANFDALAAISNISLILTTQDQSNLLAETPAIKKGFTIVADAALQDFVGKMAKDLEMGAQRIIFHLPPGSSSIKDGDLQIYSIDNSGLCLVSVVDPILERLNIGVAKSLQSLLRTTCFSKTQMGLTAAEGSLYFYIDGPLKTGENTEAMVKVGAPVQSKESSGQQLDTQFGFRFLLGVRANDTLAFADLDPSLAFIDQQMQLVDPVIVLNNYPKQTIFDLPVPTTDPQFRQPMEDLEKGITIQSKIKLLGDTSDLAAFINVDSLVCRVFIPASATSAKDIQVRIDLESGEDKETTLCLDKLLQAIPQYDAYKSMTGANSGICITKKSLSILPSAEGLAIQVNGTIQVGSVATDAIFIAQHVKDKPLAFTLISMSTGDYTFDKVIPGSPTNLGTLASPKLILSNQQTETEFEGLGKINPGLTVTGVSTFGTVIGDILNLFGANGLTMSVTIPEKLTDIEGYVAAASKEVDRSVEAVKLRKISLSIKGGKPLPIISLDIDTDAQIPTTSNTFRLVFEGDLSPTAWSLDAIAACENNFCPHIDGILNMPLSLEATQDVPLSFKMNMLGAAIQGFGGSGQIKFGNRYILTAFNIIPSDINKSAISGSFEKLCLSDLPNFIALFSRQFGSNVMLPNFMCLNNVKFSAAKEETLVGTVQIDEGLVIQGDLDFAPLGVEGSLKLKVKTPDLLTAITELDEIGIVGEGSLNKINYANIFTFTDASGNNGPSISVYATKDKLGTSINGKSTLAGGLISGTTVMSLNPTGLAVDIQGSVAGLNGEFKLQAPVAAFTNKQLDQIGFTGTINSQIGDVVEEALQDTIKGLFAGPQAGVNAALDTCNQLFGYLSFANFNCKQCLGSLSPLTLTESLLQQAVKAAQISVDGMTVSSNLGQLTKGTLPGVSINLTVFGKKIVAGPFALNAQDPAGPIKAAVAAALQSAISMEEVLQAIGQTIANTAEVTCNSSMTIGKSTGTASTHITSAAPLTSYIEVDLARVSLSDLVSFTAQAANINNLSLGDIADIGFDNVKMMITSTGASFAGSLALFGQNAVAVNGTMTSSGLSISAQLPAINNPAFSLTSAADNTAGPLVDIAFNAQQQKAEVQGALSLINGALAESVTIRLSANPVIKASGSLGGMSVVAQVQGGITPTSLNPADMQVTMTVNSDMSAVAHAVAQQALKAINEPFNQAQSQLDKIKDICNQIPVPTCVSCPPVGIAQAAVQSAQSIVNDATNKLTGFSVNSVVFTGSVSGFSVNGTHVKIPQVAVNYTFAGSTQTLTLGGFSLSAPQDVVTAVFKQVANPDAIAQQVSSAVKDLLSGSILKNASEILANAIKDMASCIGNAVGKALEEGAQEAAKAAQEAAQAVEQAAQAVGKAVDEAAKAVEQAVQEAEQEAEKAVEQAEQAAEKAAQEAEQAAQEAVQAAEEAARKAAEAAEKAARAAAAAAERAAHAVENAAKSVGHALSHF